MQVFPRIDAVAVMPRELGALVPIGQFFPKRADFVLAQKTEIELPVAADRQRLIEQADLFECGSFEYKTNRRKSIPGKLLQEIVVFDPIVEFFAAGDHHAVDGVLLPARRQRAGGKGIRLARHRLLRGRSADRIGLRAGAGFRADHGGHVRAAQSVHRHSLRRDRSKSSS